MTRLRRRAPSPASRPLDLQEVFLFLGKGPSRRELGLVADQLRELGVEVVYDEELRRLAEASGSSAFVALDLSVAVVYGRRDPFGGAEPAVAMKRSRYRRPPKASMVVDMQQGKVLGWQRADQFIPVGESCCKNPLECTRCFGPLDPWWTWWRR